MTWTGLDRDLEERRKLSSLAGKLQDGRVSELKFLRNGVEADRSRNANKPGKKNNNERENPERQMAVKATVSCCSRGQGKTRFLA